MSARRFACRFPCGRIAGRLALQALAVAAVLALAAPLAHAEKRVALVIGNSKYVHVAPLANPANDARLMADTLRDLGFDLVGGGPQLDLDEAALRGAVRDFGSQLQGADVGLFYYAGHALEVRKSNYLAPVGANPTREADIDFQMLDANLVLRQMEAAGTKLNLMILDACRNNPFAGRGFRSTTSGLGEMQAPQGTLISFATQPGNVALDGSSGHSPYTRALADAIRKPGLDIFRTFNAVGLAVAHATASQQQPWMSLSPIKGEFYFAGRGTTGDQADADKPAADSEKLARLQQQLKALEERLKEKDEPKVAVAPSPDDQPVQDDAKGWLGVQIQPVTDDIAESLGLKTTSGVLVAGTAENGPAAKAGLEPGDAILAIDGEAAGDPRSVAVKISAMAPGTLVTLTVFHKGNNVTKKVTLGAQAQKQAALQPDVQAAANAVAELGLTVEPAAPTGLAIKAIKDKSVAAERGLKPGETILEVNEKPVTNANDVGTVVVSTRSAGRKSLLLLVQEKGGQRRFVALPLDAADSAARK